MDEKELKKRYIDEIRKRCGKEGKWMNEKMLHKLTADELRNLVNHIEDAQLMAVDEYKKIRGSRH